MLHQGSMSVMRGAVNCGVPFWARPGATCIYGRAAPQQPFPNMQTADWRARGTSLWKTIPAGELATAAGKPHHLHDRWLARAAAATPDSTNHADCSHGPATERQSRHVDALLVAARARRTAAEEGRQAALARRAAAMDYWLAEHRRRTAEHQHHVAEASRRRMSLARARQDDSVRAAMLAARVKERLQQAATRRQTQLLRRGLSVRGRAARTIQQWWRLVRAARDLRATELHVRSGQLAALTFDGAAALLQDKHVLQSTAQVVAGLAALRGMRPRRGAHRVLLSAHMAAAYPAEAGADATLHRMACATAAALHAWIDTPTTPRLRALAHWQPTWSAAFGAWQAEDRTALAAVAAAEYRELGALRATVLRRMGGDGADWLLSIDRQMHALHARLARMGVPVPQHDPPPPAPQQQPEHVTPPRVPRARPPSPTVASIMADLQACGVPGEVSVTVLQLVHELAVERGVALQAEAAGSLGHRCACMRALWADPASVREVMERAFYDALRQEVEARCGDHEHTNHSWTAVRPTTADCQCWWPSCAT